MTARRLLIAHPYVYPVGGGNAVAAWALQALREDFQVTLATLGPIDYQAVNQSFGTSLREGDFAVRVAPRRYRALLGCMPTPGALMEACVIVRWARDLDAGERFDVLLSTQNEADFGRRGLQYVHFPWAYLPRPDIEMRWFHRIPGLLAAYRGFCQRLSGGSNAGLRRNLSLANSAFVAGKIKEVHGVDSVVVYPPVPGEFPDVPWERRRPAAVAVGRMNGCKRWEMAVEIVDLVRREGLDLSLTLIAHRDDPEYGGSMAALAASRPWFRILSDLSRERLACEVAQHRYGLHTMEHEHFGIAVAEMLRAGCIPFVHDSGGPVEIVGGRGELRFQDAASGARKVAAAMLDPARQEGLREFLAWRRNLFSTEEFCSTIRRIAGAFCD